MITIPPSSPAYAMWDHVADATNPLLGVALVIGLILLWRSDKIRARGIFLMTVLSVVLIYIIRTVEAHYDVWAHWGMNFSTHAAMNIALGLGLALVWPRRWWVFGLIFIAYCWLMMIMQYHTLADILTTSVLILPLCGLCQYLAWRRRTTARIEEGA